MPGSTRTRLPKVTQYVRNVGKSVAFASINAVKENMEGIKGFTEDNHDVFVEIYSSAKNYRETIKKAERSIRNSDLYKAIEFGTKSMIEDAKSGNFYNDRTSEISESALGLDDDSLGLDFNYEVTDVESSGSSSRYVADAFGEAMRTSTVGTTTAVAKGTDMVVRSTKASTTILSNQIERSTATLHSGLGAVYNSINQINQFLNGPMMAHLENSRTYYDHSLQLMREQHAMMKEMLEMQRNLYTTQAKQYQTSKLDQSMSSNGMMDMKGYMKVVKGNLKELVSMYDPTGGLMGAGSGMNIPLLFAAQPFKLMMDMLVGGLMPEKLKNNLKAFDTAATGLFSQFIGKMNKNKNSAGLKGILANIFGIDIENKTSINTGNYNKGAVAFDGITRKTIVEVIPGYLARIEAALTGAGERHYDPHKGVWKSAKQIYKDFEKDRINTIEGANRDITYDIENNRKFKSKEYQNAIRRMKEKIYEDGFFDPKIIYDKKSRADHNGRRVRKSSGNAYKEYGFESQEMFDAVLSALSDRTLAGLAQSNMRAKQNRSRRLHEYEAQGGIYNVLFNDSYNDGSSKEGSYSNPAKFATGGLLNNSRDKYGKNVFYYLREILRGIDGRWKSGSSSGPSTGGSGGGTRVRVNAHSRDSKTSSESEDDSGSEDDDSSPWDEVYKSFEEEEAKAAEERAKKEAAKDWVDDNLKRSPIGRFFKKSIRGVSNIIASPLKFINDLLEQANNNMFSLMFGDMKLRDADGNEVNNVFKYIIDQVKGTFDELGKYIKDKFHQVIDPLWQKLKEKARPYVEPVWNELKNMGRAAGARVRRGLSNTFGRAGSAILEHLPQDLVNRITNRDVVGADEVEDAMDDREMYQDNDEFYDNIVDSAHGRLVTKRGLTMISPGEIIIPASFNKKKQKKMLALEKRDRNRIVNAIGLNATGTVDTTTLKEQLGRIYAENNGENKGAKIGAGGVAGLGAGLIVGINPLLAAMAGAGLSILNNSDTLKNIVFGEEIDGERQGGIVSKKIQDTFKKYAPDMTDYGIAGGVLGLLTPFGPLGGAAIGAGVGFLKNSEGFKKFIFGEDGKNDGLLNKEAFDAFKEKVKKAAPKVLAGAGIGILTGPFGILGNAALGAGVGLISTTETFQNFLYGEADENGERHGGVIDAFKTGFLEPAKEKFLEFAVDLKEYSKKHIFEPMKNFWKPVNQMLKNVVQGVGDKVSDFINDMFERTLGLPMHDFLQEKIFKPMSKLMFGILKAPYKMGRFMLSAPFRALGGIGNSIRASQIRRGTAYDMSASERLAWRDQHNIRFNRFNRFKDKRLLQDQQLADMELGDIEGIYQSSKAGLSSYASLQREVGKARKAVGDEVSKFFNTSTQESRNRFNKVGYNSVKKLTEIAQTKSVADANEYIDKMRNLTDDEKEDLKKKIAEKVKAAEAANSTMDLAKTGNAELDKMLSKALGYKVKGRKDRRKLMRSAEAELKARRSAAEKANESPEVNATNNLAEIFSNKSDKIIEQFIAANKYLEAFVTGGKKDTSPPGDKENAAKKQLETDLKKSHSEDKPESTAVDEATENIKKQEKKAKSPFGKLLAKFGIGGSQIDEDSKEGKELKAEAEEDDVRNEKNLRANEESVSILTRIKEALIGKKDTEETGFLGKLWKGIGTVGKYIGIGGLVLGGVSLFGHLSQWFKVDIWPKLKTLLFGTKDEEGNTLQQGLLGKLGTSIKTTLLGEDGYSGLLGGIRRILFGDEGGNGGLFGKARGFITEWWTDAKKWLSDSMNKAADWFNDQGGFKGLFTNTIIPGFINGLGYAVNNLLGPAIGALLKAAPSLLSGLGKALLEGIKIAFINRGVGGSRHTVSDNGAAKEYEAAISTVNSTIEGADTTGTVSNIKAAWGNLVSAFKGTGTTDIDNSTIFSDSSSDKNNTKSGGIMGALGQTKRTNTIEYDENGNITTDYTRFNTTDSLASYTANAAGRSFLKGLGGNNIAGKAIKGLGDDIATAGANLIKPGIGSKVKSIFGFTKAAGKASINTVGTAGKAGSGLKNVIDDVAGSLDYNGKFLDTAANAVDDVAGASAKKGILSGITNIFKNIASSNSIISKIVKVARSVTSKEVTERIVQEAIEKIGEKLGKTLVAKATTAALKGLGNVIAKFSPLTIAIFIKDFVWGFDNADTVLGVAKGTSFHITLGHKCICGLVNMLTNFFTLGLLPADVIMDICIDYLFPIFGMDMSSIQAARDEAQAAMDEWNLANPDNTFDNLQDFNNKDKWWFKAGQAISAGWDGAKEKIATGWTNVKNGVSTTFKNMGSSITNFVENVIKVVPEVTRASANMTANAWKLGGEADRDETITETGNSVVDTLANVAFGVVKVYTFPNRMLGKGINLVKEGFTKFLSAASNVASVVSSGISDTFTKASNGNLSGITSGLQKTTGNNTTDAIANVVFGVSKVFTTPLALGAYGFSKIKSNFSTTINKWSIAKAAKASDDTKIQNALDGKISVFSSDYWKNADQSKNGLFGAIVTVQTYIEKLMNAPIAILRSVIESIKNGLSSVKDFFGDGFKSIYDWATGFFGGSRSSNTTGTTTVKSAATGGIIGGKWFGKGHIYQSGTLSNMPYGDSTIGDSGCAPVAAANLIGGSVRDAARYAERNGMTVPGGGTDIDFFNSYLGSKGIVTRNTSSRSGVMTALANGNPVIMLGRDNYNNGAPFGTNPHYITAKGISPNGNIIVEDPDLPYSSIEYAPDAVMDSMITSVVAGDGRRRHFGRKRGLFGKGQAEYDMLANDGWTVSSPYGMRNGSMHKGVDLYKSNNAPIYAFTNGTVKYLSSSYRPDSGYYGSPDGGGFGNYVTMIDDNGYYHVYAHMNGTNASVGQTISRGQKIGIQGHTGSSTGSHLHYQITSGSVSGTSTDPYTYLKNYNSNSSASSVPTSSSSSSSGSTSGSSDYVSTSTSSAPESNNRTSNLITAFGNLGKSMVKAIFGESAYNALYGDNNNSSNSYEEYSSSSSDGLSSDSGSSSSGSSTSSGSNIDYSNAGTVSDTSGYAKIIWDRLKTKGYTNAGIAGLMGNINAESGYRSNNLQDTYNNSLGMTDQEYTSKVNNKSYSKDKFVNDSAGYGLAQWTWGPRKKGLYEATIGAGNYINSINHQIDYMDSELRGSYSSVGNLLRSTNDINAASDKVLKVYENPANADAQVDVRRKYSWQAYNTFAGKGRAAGSGGTATRALNGVRSGRARTAGTAYTTANMGVDYVTFLKTIIEILISISNNTALLNSILNILSSKFDINIDAKQVTDATSNTTRAQAERALNQLMNSNTDASRYAKVMNNKDTQYLVNAMAAIASE